MPRRSQKNTLKEAIQVFLAQGGSMDEINEITTQLSAEKEKEESKSTENSSKEVSGAGAGEEKADTPNQARAQTLSGDGSEGGISVGGSSDAEVAEGSTSTKSRYSIGSQAFALSENRGRTIVGPQAEHSAAYTQYETLVKNSINGVPMSQAPRALSDAFSCFPISQDRLDSISEETKRMTQEVRRFRGARRNLKDQKESDPNFLSEHFDANNEALIIATRTSFSRLTAFVMDECIFGANKMPNVTFPTEGVPANPNTGQEQTAKNELQLLNYFIETVHKVKELREKGDDVSLEKMAEKRMSILGSDKTIEKLTNIWGVDRENINSLLSENPPPIDSIFNRNLQKKIADNMGKLSYYPRLDPEKSWTGEIDGRREVWAVSKEKWDEVMKRDPETGRTISGSKPKYNQGTLPRSNNLDDMYKTVGQELVVTFNCFKGLSRFSAENQVGITNSFLQDSVLKEGGWKEEIPGRLMAEKLRTLKERGISQHCNFSYENRTFCTKDSKAFVDLERKQRAAEQEDQEEKKEQSTGR